MNGPDDLNPERAVLGAVLAGYRDVAALFDIVKAEDFDNPQHEMLWAVVQELVNAGKTPEPISVLNAAGERSRRLPGGPTYLTDLFQAAPNPTSAPYYAEAVRDQAIRRRIATAATKITLMAQESMDAGELADRARGEMEKATTTDFSHNLVTLSATLEAVYDIAQNGHQGGLNTGWPGIDRLTRGLQPGRLIVVGARPGVGKSLMGTNLAHWVSSQHRKASLICTMEMPAYEVSQRIVSHAASVPLGSLDSGQVSEAGWNKLSTAHPELEALGIYIEDDAAQSLTSVRSAISRVGRQRDDLALVVVDYLQIMKPRDPSVARAEQIGEMSRGLKIIAREFNVCVVAMAQINRASLQRANGKPTLADLRESGSIEADADIVLLLHRVDNDDGTPGTVVDVLIEKNRSGARGSATLTQQGHFARLSESSWSPTANIA